MIIENFVIKSQFESYDKKIIHRYLLQLNFKNKFVYCINLTDLLQNETSSLLWITDDIKYYMKLEKNASKKFIILIDANNEAPTYRDNLKFQIDFIIKHCNLNLEDVIIVSGAYHQFNEPIKYSFCFCTMKKFDIFENTTHDSEPKYHFVSLARIARHHRILATIDIIERGLEKYGNLSLGSNHDLITAQNDFLKSKIFKKYKNKFPMYIDDEILDASSKLKRNMYKASNEKISHAFINFVMESAYENKKNNFNVIESWSVPLISEKSAKPFAWGQVPIFLNCANSLHKLRELGFDLFDDIIDHGYDSESNPMTRIKLVVDQLEKICGWSLEECIVFKKENMQRFENNRKLLLDLHNYKFDELSINNLQKTLDSYDL
jgi:hypothetical protein